VAQVTAKAGQRAVEDVELTVEDAAARGGRLHRSGRVASGVSASACSVPSLTCCVAAWCVPHDVKRAAQSMKLDADLTLPTVRVRAEPKHSKLLLLGTGPPR